MIGGEGLSCGRCADVRVSVPRASLKDNIYDKIRYLQMFYAKVMYNSQASRKICIFAQNFANLSVSFGK